MSRRGLSIAVAVAIAAAAFEPFYLRIFFTDRARLAAALTELPYHKLPGMRRFMLDVRACTRDGDTIAIASTMRRAPLWSGGYDYLYLRARYLLGGRTVVPLIGTDNRPQPQWLAKASYVAAYRCDPALPGFAAVRRWPDGVLLRRAP